ncbi:hypothetical protein TNCV_3506041 [Trichonephila clavipes]|uniref:Uncharacterized protein n=1 Tax=Trichonephila clavipes TaxID=2585209 RepID=A0A8X6VCS6_TRICX|nr:hypothetical protein TNCV_3506041 [Trichonephila clavipes]
MFTHIIQYLQFDYALALRVTCASLSWTTGWWVPTRTPFSSLPSAPDHRPARLESASSILPPSLTPGGCLDSALYSMFMWKFPTTLGHPHKQCPHCSRTKDLK